VVHGAMFLNHVEFVAALNLILNYVKFRTNHEPNVVHGVVQGSISFKPCKFQDASFFYLLAVSFFTTQQIVKIEEQGSVPYIEKFNFVILVNRHS
jgi:hypothetical protein